MVLDCWSDKTSNVNICPPAPGNSDGLFSHFSDSMKASFKRHKHFILKANYLPNSSASSFASLIENEMLYNCSGLYISLFSIASS